jgi:phosphatidylglycerol---prolipoprotein diacylglyceryl transferase
MLHVANTRRLAYQSLRSFTAFLSALKKISVYAFLLFFLPFKFIYYNFLTYYCRSTQNSTSSMYPNLYYIFREWFGVEWNGLQYINTFGFFVALAFVGAGIILAAELKRKAKQNLLQSIEQKIMVGKPASIAELLVNFILGFVFGYKLVGAFIGAGAQAANPQDFIFSWQGSWPAGILLGLLFAGIKWREKNRQKLDKPAERSIRIWPHDRVGDIVIVGAIFGFAGAKLFDNLENWDRFVKDPIGNLISPSGLTYYGGLICAALAIWWYAGKKKIGFWQLNDAAAPALMLSYAPLGRLGCQVSGDGDWGILNSAYVAEASGKVQLATPEQFQTALEINKAFFLKDYSSLQQVPHLSVKAPSFLPDWLFAYTYPHNVNKEGIRIPDCNWDEYCQALPLPVFPTPVYEMIACLFLFFLIWFLRKRFMVAGMLFGFYLVLNGLERFFIEKIRVNTKYENLPFQPTQAELISLVLILVGLFLMAWLPRRNKEAASV